MRRGWLAIRTLRDSNALCAVEVLHTAQCDLTRSPYRLPPKHKNGGGGVNTASWWSGPRGESVLGGRGVGGGISVPDFRITKNMWNMRDGKCIDRC